MIHPILSEPIVIPPTHARIHNSERAIPGNPLSNSYLMSEVDNRTRNDPLKPPSRTQRRTGLCTEAC